MAKKTEERKESKESTEDVIIKTWADSNAAFSKLWEDSYLKLYKPWIESAGEMLDKTAKISEDATPQKYKEFYDEWAKTYKNSFGKFYPAPAPKTNKESLKVFLANAERYNKLYKSWIQELEDNSIVTKEILSGKPDPAKYKECHDKWTRSYEKIFDELMEMPLQDGTKEIFGKYMEIPDIYMGSFLQMSKLFKKSYAQLCKPLNDSIMTLSDKMAEISSGNADPEAYKEFYNLWVDTYKDTYGKYVKSMEPEGEMFEKFLDSTSIYLGMYKSWITALETMSEKAREMSIQNSDPDSFREFNNVWLKMYEKAFESFFEDMPTMGGPMKEVMEPVKIMAKMYADTFVKISKMWVGQDAGSATAYPGKNKR
ncbi:MAG: hypothetical protein OIN87_09995 [Candidatus Methanoperedens sp.]|nr:hypothetical protein [Candidatus Methanoperedens sp.]